MSAIYIFWGLRGDLVKVLWHDGVDVALRHGSTGPVRPAGGKRRGGRNHGASDGVLLEAID